MCSKNLNSKKYVKISKSKCLKTQNQIISTKNKIIFTNFPRNVDHTKFLHTCYFFINFFEGFTQGTNDRHKNVIKKGMQTKTCGKKVETLSFTVTKK